LQYNASMFWATSYSIRPGFRGTNKLQGDLDQL